MITFDLICENGHKFEGWFENNNEYEDQKETGLLTCPICESSIVNKELSPVGLIKSNTSNTSVTNENDILKQTQLFNDTLKKINDYVDKNFVDVGSDFTKKALKIHYGVDEPKNIKGTTTQEDEKVLKKEGINFLTLPKLGPEVK